jgi:hypothetical protein
MQPRDVGREEADWIKNRARIGRPPASVGEVVTRLVRLRHYVAHQAKGDPVLALALKNHGLDWPSDPAG